MRNEKIWVSRAMMDSRLLKFFDSDALVKEPQKTSKIIKSNMAGVPLSGEDFPEEVYCSYPDKKYKRLPDFCQAAGWTVSEAVADVLCQFDMGQGAVYPVRVMQHDRTTPVSGTYFQLNFGNVKEAFVPEMSPKARKPIAALNWWYLPPVPKTGNIAVRITALEGPDIWVDSKLKEAFFLSDCLAQALMKAKLTRHFGLSECRILHDN